MCEKRKRCCRDKVYIGVVKYFKFEEIVVVFLSLVKSYWKREGNLFKN